MDDVRHLLSVKSLLVQRSHLVMQFSPFVVVLFNFNSVLSVKLLVLLISLLKSSLQLWSFSGHLLLLFSRDSIDLVLDMNTIGIIMLK